MSQLNSPEPSLVRSASATISCNFRSVSRHKKANWGNRFLRDHYDLVYEANPESIANRASRTAKNKRKSSKKPQQNRELLMKYQYTPFKGRGQLFSSESAQLHSDGLDPSQYLNGMKVFEAKLRSGVTTAPQSQRRGRGRESRESVKKNGERQREQRIEQVVEESNGKGSNQYGLSRYQYNQTLQGKLQLRLNHHIDFEKNKTYKIDNHNKIWYNNDQDLADFKLKQPKHLHNIHSFRSYSSHKLFFRTKKMYDDNGSGNGGMLDKYHNALVPHLSLHQHGLNNRTNHKKMTGKPGLPKKLGTNLDYNVQERKTLGKGDGKRPLIERTQSKRQLVFGREVIDPKRACYR